MEENKNFRTKVVFETVEQAIPDTPPEAEGNSPMYDSSIKEKIDAMKITINNYNQIIENLQKVSYENSLNIKRLFNEKGLLLKQYQKNRYKKYQHELDAAIKISMAEASGRNSRVQNDYTYEDLLSLQETIGFVKVGLSEDNIQSIPVKNLDDNMVCSICLNTGNFGKVLLCGHFFHQECIDQWLREKKTCPFCLTEVMPR